ncbi:hypothetical protein Hypma_013247 [Hypsizygus marmoreus]|uniref:Mixed lineage kinase domain-containing protein n=1 Tax=Hypsizygus marmoreus TaxID=39966 RepID=A0A369JEI7_HYPMA|nr:hypothetical protein Hypma_013247 [Hypsizygus marmoreus]
MPLRFVKVPRVNTQDVLHIAVSATSLTRELSSMSFFPPATAAVSIVLLILQTLQGVQNNKEACFRLARRCARILLDINDQMVGRWDTAPPTLIKNLERFQDTLTSIHEFMKIQTDITWARRFMKKTSIENAISEYSTQLDDATQSFQIATLIDIHYAVSATSKALRPSLNAKPSLAPPPYVATTEMDATIESTLSTLMLQSPIEMDHTDIPRIPETRMEITSREEDVEDHIISHDVLEDRGFRRYHQSEVRLKGRSNLKGGWWTGASAAEVEGQPSLIKRYEGPGNQAMKLWMRDVKLLQDIYHPSLPQMIGFSAEGAPTPFILISNVQTRSPQSMLLSVLQTEGLAGCVDLILRFYEDVQDATLYIQRQWSLDDHGAQDFIGDASYRVDGSGTVIMGLPPPRDGWLTMRSYGLTESLKMAVMGMLPKCGTIQYRRVDEIDEGDITRQVSHVVTLARSLLPADNAPIVLPSHVKALLSISVNDEEDYDEFTKPFKPSLRQLRLTGIEAGTHNHVWHENGGIPAHKFIVGDFGYIPEGKDFTDFVILGNVFEDNFAKFEVESNVYGEQWCWKDIPLRRQPIDPFSLPGDANCWPIAVPPNAQIDCLVIQSSFISHIGGAWRFLLLDGKDLAMKYGIKPEEIMMITRAGTNQDFYIRDFSTPGHAHLQHHQQLGHQRFGHTRPAFNSPHTAHHHQWQSRGFAPHQNTLPSIMYLLTSSDPNYSPYWSHNPVSVPAGTRRPELRRGWTYKIGWCTGFVNWIQLHPEDFRD